MAWRCPGDKPLSEPRMISLPMHIYASMITRPQWVIYGSNLALMWGHLSTTRLDTHVNFLYPVCTMFSLPPTKAISSDSVLWSVLRFIKFPNDDVRKEFSVFHEICAQFCLLCFIEVFFCNCSLIGDLLVDILQGNVDDAGSYQYDGLKMLSIRCGPFC